MSELSAESNTTAPSFSSNNHPPSEHHSIRITNIQLNGDNFLRWSLSVRMYIRGRGKLGYLTGDKLEPDKSDSQYTTWDAENSMVMAWLVNAMEEDIGANYLGYSTAKEMWDNLNQMYSNLGNQSQIYELKLKLGETKQGAETVTKYFAKLKRLWQDLDMFNEYIWKDPADGTHFQKVVNNDRVFQFLAGLNVDFDEVRGRIIGKQSLPSINEVFAKVRREESRRGVMLGKNGGLVNPTESSALVAGETATFKGSALEVSDPAAFKSYKPEEKPKVWCDYCNRPRHTREHCWKLHGKPTNWKSKEKGKSATAATFEQPLLNKQQVDQLLRLLKPSAESNSNSNSGLLAQTGQDLGYDDWQC